MGEKPKGQIRSIRFGQLSQARDPSKEFRGLQTAAVGVGISAFFDFLGRAFRSGGACVSGMDPKVDPKDLPSFSDGVAASPKEKTPEKPEGECLSFRVRVHLVGRFERETKGQPLFSGWQVHKKRQTQIVGATAHRVDLRIPILVLTQGKPPAS